MLRGPDRFNIIKFAIQGQFNDPLSGKRYSPPFLPSACLSWSQTLEGLFELTRRPSSALNLNGYIAKGITELLGHRYVCRTFKNFQNH